VYRIHKSKQPVRYTLTTMEKAIMYFFSIGAVVYIVLVGSYLVLHADFSATAQPVLLTSNESLLMPDIYTDTKSGFTIRIPKSWMIDNDRAHTTGAIFFSYAGSGSEELRSIKITREAVPFSEQKIIRGNPSDFSYFMKGAQVSKNVLVSVHNKNVRLLEASININGILHREYVLFLVKDNYLFVISGIARDSLWSKYKDEIQASLLSFKVL